MRYDVLPHATVAYTHVRGAYPEVPKVYGTLVQYMNKLNWLMAGPIREIYLVDPSTVQGTEEHIAEVQMPWRPL